MPELEGYPEKRPTGISPINRFTFSVSAVSVAQKDTQLQIEALEERIQTIIKAKGIINDMPILSHILSMTRDQETLKGLAKGLDRVADLVGPLDELKSKKAVLELAETNPEWFAWAFGDFDEPIEKLINSIREE